MFPNPTEMPDVGVCNRRRVSIKRWKAIGHEKRGHSCCNSWSVPERGNMRLIGKIRHLSLREVWRHEAYDFTAWLEENIDVLNDALDLSLGNVYREHNAGSFSVDLVAEDDDGNIVVIENQLERSNHDHLGKVITYLTALEARTAIWVVAEPRPEHIRAIAWLNESSAAAFYLVKVEAISIDDSPPAALLTMITGPSIEAIRVGERKKELAGLQEVRYRFWEQLLDKAKEKTNLHKSISPTHKNWVASSTGLPSRLSLNYYLRGHDARVELYIDHDTDTGEGNMMIFNQIKANKEQIEEVFGEPLDWEALEGRRACRISKTIPIGGWEDEDSWPKIHEAMIDAMIRLDKSLRPYVRKPELPR